MSKFILNWYHAKQIIDRKDETFTSNFSPGSMIVRIREIDLPGVRHTCVWKVTQNRDFPRIIYYLCDRVTTTYTDPGLMIYHDAGRRKKFLIEDWIRGYLRRWRNYAKRKRATRIIRRFYFDYIVPRLYNPHTNGSGYLKLLNKLKEF